MKTAPTGTGIGLLLSLFLSFAFAIIPVVAQAQSLTFSFQVSLNGETSDDLQFGLREDAMQGIDNYDVPEPPAAPNASFVSYLAMFNAPTSLPNRWRHDFRPTVSLLADRIELWQFDFQTAAIGSEVTITIDTVGAVPVPYELYFFGPGVYYEPIEVPDTITFPVLSDKLVFFWELRLADEVTTTATTWGGIKSLYR